MASAWMEGLWISLMLPRIFSILCHTAADTTGVHPTCTGWVRGMEARGEQRDGYCNSVCVCGFQGCRTLSYG